MATHKIVLDVRDVALYYGGVKAVDGVNLRLNEGSIHGLIGPNGAGKSTVVDAITGRRPITRGRVVLNNTDISAMTVIERRRRGLSRSFQRTSIFENLGVWEQVLLAAHKVLAEDPEEDALDVVTQLDMLDVLHQDARTLGYGQQRRLDLALALVGAPTVLLLDEPMAGLSAQESSELAEHLKKLSGDRKISILLIEHDTNIIFGISDVVTAFELGRVIANGSPDAVRAHPRVREAYLGSAA